MPKYVIDLTDRDAILAGLRLLQEAIIAGWVRDEIADIATCGDEHAMPSVERIDELCERLNS
jgi:hypothetical protein